MGRGKTEEMNTTSSLSDKVKGFISKVEKAVTPSKGSTIDQVKSTSKSTANAIDKDS